MLTKDETMPSLPSIIIALLNPFAPCFYGVTTWTNAQILLIGTILTTGKRTVTAALRVMGLKDDPHFAAYHHVLNRAVWSSLEVAQVMLRLVVTTFGALGQPLIFGLDDMIERRRGANI